MGIREDLRQFFAFRNVKLLVGFTDILGKIEIIHQPSWSDMEYLYESVFDSYYYYENPPQYADKLEWYFDSYCFAMVITNKDESEYQAALNMPISPLNLDMLKNLKSIIDAYEDGSKMYNEILECNKSFNLEIDEEVSIDDERNEKIHLKQFSDIDKNIEEGLIIFIENGDSYFIDYSKTNQPSNTNWKVKWLRLVINKYFPEEDINRWDDMSVIGIVNRRMPIKYIEIHAFGSCHCSNNINSDELKSIKELYDKGYLAEKYYNEILSNK